MGDIQKDKGVLGLHWAFKMAGVPNIIMLVADTGQQDFGIHAIILRIIFLNIPVSEAFYHAQEKMKKKYRG